MTQDLDVEPDAPTACDACGVSDELKPTPRVYHLCDSCYNQAGAQHAAVRKRLLNGERPTNWQAQRALYDENGVLIARVTRVVMVHHKDSEWDPDEVSTQIVIEAESV